MVERIIFHIDVNSAFLSWEATYRLNILGETEDLRETVAVIGGSIEARHGIILAKSIPAKKYNIKTGESIMEAKQKCPDVIVIPPDYNLYEKCSIALMAILKQYTPDVEQFSIDEAFLDMTGACHGNCVDKALEIKNRIRDTLGFTVNIGVSNNKLLAKMASDFEKPDRVHTLFLDEIADKMWPLPVSDLYYVGRATFAKLHRLGIRTIGELAQMDVDILKSIMRSHGQVIWNYANGIDYSKVESEIPQLKGYGNSTTTSFDVTTMESAKMVILGLCETIGTRIRKDSAEIRVVGVSIRFQDDLSFASMQKTLDYPTNITNEIYHAACIVLLMLWNQKRALRHLGVHTGQVSLDCGVRQMSLFDPEDIPDYTKQKTCDRAIDAIRERFGKDSVMRGPFVSNPDIDHMSGGISKDRRGLHIKNE